MAMFAKALLITVASAELRLTSALDFDVAGAKDHPVSKVVNLLKDMQKELQTEADADEEVYEKYACFCTKNDKSKTQSISDAETRIGDLDATVNKMAALSQTLQVEIAGVKKEIAQSQKSLATATAMREKATASFTGEEKDMIESIRSLKAALTVISKHHGGSSAAFLNNGAVMQAYATAKALMAKHINLLRVSITPSQRHMLSAFVQGVPAKPASASQAYAPQSGQIFGILKQMQETFETDLSESQKQEIADQASYLELKKAKEAEIQASSDSLEAKSEQLANADQTLAQSKEDREDTYASLAVDKKFLMELKVNCKMTDTEWAARQKLRQDELTAVAKAIEVLSSDQARDQFSKTFNPTSFLQMQKTEHGNRAKAVAVLTAAAVNNPKNPKLTALAVASSLQPMPKVTKAIDDMIEALLDEKADEIKEKKFCSDESFKNEKDTATKVHTKGKLENKEAKITQTVKEQQAAIDTLTAEMDDIVVQRKKAADDRAAENAEFKKTIADQTATEGLLNEALTALKSVYGAALIQQTPPKNFDKYGQSRASGGIIGLIEHIITNTQLMTKEAQVSEKKSMDGYTKLVQAMTDSTKVKADAKVDLQSQKAQADMDLVSAKGELKGTSDEIEKLEETKGDLIKRCSFMVKNFEVSQKARDEEVEALRQAKAFLKGMTQ